MVVVHVPVLKLSYLTYGPTSGRVNKMDDY